MMNMFYNMIYIITMDVNKEVYLPTKICLFA